MKRIFLFVLTNIAVLAVLSVSILGAGVIWALRLHVPQKFRLLSVIASLAALAAAGGSVLLWLVLSSQPQPPGMGKTRRTPRMDQAAGGRHVSKSPQLIEIYVRPDGTVLVEGEVQPLERPVSHLQQAHQNQQLGFVICPSADVSTGVVMGVIDDLQRQGVKEYTLRVAQ